jgi:hypothetical protein
MVPFTPPALEIQLENRLFERYQLDVRMEEMRTGEDAKAEALDTVAMEPRETG